MTQTHHDSNSRSSFSETAVPSGPLWSVVVIARNEEASIATCLESVLHTFEGRSYELIFVDSASTDNTVLIASRFPAFFFATYLPGYLGGLALCALHGHYEHAGGVTSHYGAVYNLLLFNDGYHVEHHANPGAPWHRLPHYRGAAARVSRWPAPLRWMERFSLDSLERLVLHSRVLQRFVLRSHARAFRELMPSLPRITRVAVVGGGLFPRSYLILSALLPSARITIIDADADNLARARALVDPSRVEIVHARYAERDDDRYDLLVIPLSFDGDRSALYAHPPAPAVIVHDWIWRKRGDSRIVSVALLKRVNLVHR